MSNVVIGLVVVAGIMILQSAISVQGQDEADPRCESVGQTVYDDCGQRCECSSRRTLVRCVRIRKEFTSMSSDERQQYINTIKTASTSSRYKRRYGRLITIHRNYFSRDFGTDRHIHGKAQFLPWHRWFLLRYENLLRNVDPCFTVAYWDWVSVSATAFDTASSTSLWHSNNGAFGGNGRPRDRCVITGPFRRGEWSLVRSAGRGCLTREFRGVPPNLQELSVLLNTPVQNFHQFEFDLRREFHDSVHCLIGATMCGLDAASAPEFFLHHGFIDKIWEDWQKKSPAHRTVFFSDTTTRLTAARSTHSTSDFLDNTALPGGNRVEYAEHGNRELRQITRVMEAMPVPQLMRIEVRVPPSPLSQAAIDLFNVSSSEVRRIRLRESKFRPILRSPKGNEKPLTGIDKQLGFEHKKVLEMANKAKSNPKRSRDEGKSRPEEASGKKPAPLTGIDKGLGFEHKKVLEIARKAKSEAKPSQDEKPSCSEMVES